MKPIYTPIKKLTSEPLESLQDIDVDFDTEVPVMCTDVHILNQIVTHGRYVNNNYKLIVYNDVEGKDKLPTVYNDADGFDKIPLDVTISINNLQFGDLLDEKFTSSLRIYAFWSIDLRGLGMDELANRAESSDHYIHMTVDEMKQFEALSVFPTFNFRNSSKVDMVDPATCHVYGGRNDNMCGLLWNAGYNLTCTESLNFRDFPFDVQFLNFEIGFGDLKAFRTFSVTVVAIQLHTQALQNDQWSFLVPSISPYIIKSSGTKIKLNLRRRPYYYIQQIFIPIIGLLFINMLIFSSDPFSTGERLGALFTNLFFVVTHKLSIAEILPKVPYNTIVDSFMIETCASMAITACFLLFPSFLLHPNDVQRVKNLNRIMIFLSFCLIVVVSVLWYFRASLAARHNAKYTSIKIIENRNWYCFRFKERDYMASRSELDGIIATPRIKSMRRNSLRSSFSRRLSISFN
eukprot:gene12457-16709_t